MAVESINTYFNATDINIYKQMKHIFINTEQHIHNWARYSKNI